MDPNRTRAGFSLAELLIAMTFAMILAAIALYAFSGPKKEAFRSAMQSDLRSLAVIQELYHQNNFRYGKLADLTTFTSTPGVVITIEHTSGAGFAATATHTGLPGVTCGIYMGKVPPHSRGPATEPRRPVCD